MPTLPSTPRRPFLLFAACAAGVIGGCSPQSATSGVEGPTASEERPMPLGATSQERFGGMPGAAAPPSAAAPSDAAGAGSDFHYTLPEGWTEAGPKPMRDVNLFAPGGVECWLTRLGPGAGGLQANVDRWRNQLGVGPASPEELAALRRRGFMGDTALRVDISSPDGSLRMVGLMQFLSDRSMFLRMSGPADSIAANLARFEAFADSLHDGAGHSHGDAGGTSSASGGGAGIGGAPATEAQAASGTPGSAGGLRWVAPEGWKPLEPDSFRLAWFQLAPETQCWITTLGGDGGGVEANLTRWHSQFGRPAPRAADIAALPSVKMLGQEALYVDLLGEGAVDGMIGVLCQLPSQAVFVKIQGPSDEVRANEAAFRAFCATLEQP